MSVLDATISLIRSDGLLLLFPLAVVEGPIVTVIAAYLASLGYLDILRVYFVVVLADLAGDVGLFVLGRFWHRLIPAGALRFGVDDRRLAQLEEHFRLYGGRTLLFRKVTHSAGFLILLAAGASGMPLRRFIYYNFLGTIPKSLFFSFVGYTFGYAYKSIDSYIYRGSAIVLVFVALAGLLWFASKNRNRE